MSNDDTSTHDANLGELTYTRIYDATPEVMFACMTTPPGI